MISQSRPNSRNEERLTESDIAVIDVIRENVLKKITETLTDLLDPAR